MENLKASDHVRDTSYDDCLTPAARAWQDAQLKTHAAKHRVSIMTQARDMAAQERVTEALAAYSRANTVEALRDRSHALRRAVDEAEFTHRWYQLAEAKLQQDAQLRGQ